MPETTSWDRDATKDLIVEPGKPKTISPGSIRHYRDFIVKKDALLKIDNGTQKFTHIKVSRDFILDGEISVRSFRSGRGSFNETAPDGETLYANLDEENNGGKGGDGGKYNTTYGPQKNGGLGAAGTKEFGGGGGGGAGIHPSFRPKPVKGVDASGKNGAIQTGIDNPGGIGGNGGERGNNLNGGYLYFLIAGTIKSWQGVIDARGSKGVEGKDGTISLGGGGGGGGGPGGHGGIIVVKHPYNIGDINVLLDGGDGGDGGTGGGPGTRAARYRWGGNGYEGQRGKPGYLEEI